MDTLIKNHQDGDGWLLQLRKLNVDDLIDRLGILKRREGYRFDFFNRSILFDGNGFADLSGEPLQPAIIDVFCHYFLNTAHKPIPSSGRLVTFREFPNAGPLFSRFTENTNKTIEQTFTNKLRTLREKCKTLFSIPISKPSYDLSVRFKALPPVPVILQFNDADERLPAKSNFLFHDDADKYMD